MFELDLTFCFVVYTNLRFNYRIHSDKKISEYKSLPLNFNPNAINQQYFHQVELTPLNLKAGDELEYFVEVSVIYQSKQNLLQLENQYQKVMAQIYKSKL